MEEIELAIMNVYNEQEEIMKLIDRLSYITTFLCDFDKSNYSKKLFDLKNEISPLIIEMDHISNEIKKTATVWLKEMKQEHAQKLEELIIEFKGVFEGRNRNLIEKLKRNNFSFFLYKVQ